MVDNRDPVDNQHISVPYTRAQLAAAVDEANDALHEAESSLERAGIDVLGIDPVHRRAAEEGRCAVSQAGNAKAKQALREFSPRGSVCPLCGQEFRGCQHSVQQAVDRLEQNVIRTLISQESQAAGDAATITEAMLAAHDAWRDLAVARLRVLDSTTHEAAINAALQAKKAADKLTALGLNSDTGWPLGKDDT